MTLSASQTNKSVTGDGSVQSNIRERVELTDENVLPFLAECRLRLISQIPLSLSASSKCSSHMSVPIPY